MILKSTRTYTQDDEEFEDILDQLEKKYFHNGGDEEAEVIVNWNKREAKEDGVVCLFAANSVISNAIKRCRKGIRKVEPLPIGANLYFDTKYVRPLHMVLKVAK
jgi:hypothetical protein